MFVAFAEGMLVHVFRIEKPSGEEYGAICVPLKIAQVIPANDVSPRLLRLSSEDWKQLAFELRGTLPARPLPRESAVVRAFAIGAGAPVIHVRYLTVVPLEGSRW
jgi:hypothetical protein